ncbi:hypothetical protein COLO4_32111 [Corchorus olitorius]|uniref:Uncharacterized protein n=1 Tax=Corchorus olitorius TaxID=93759 RepID=A0A1R3H150_9ROSI|nr:hypothetical protein COLO4_32111 [Corchorus olitorius]
MATCCLVSLKMIDISIKNGKLEGEEGATDKKNQGTKKNEGDV